MLGAEFIEAQIGAVTAPADLPGLHCRADGAVGLPAMAAVREAALAYVGGKLADLNGLKRTLAFSSCILVAGAAVFAFSQNLLLAAVMIVIMGLGSNLGYSAMVTLGQLYLPNHIGLASGVTLGLSVSIGGILAPVLGSIGDVYGLRLVFYILAGLAVIQTLISFAVPSR